MNKITVTNDGDGCAHICVTDEAGQSLSETDLLAGQQVEVNADGGVQVGEVTAVVAEEVPAEAPAGDGAGEQEPGGVAEGTPGDSSDPGGRPGEGQPGSEVSPPAGEGEGQQGAAPGEVGGPAVN